MSSFRPTTRPDRARLLRAYRATTYAVGGVELRIGRRVPALDARLRDLNARTACLLGADNPGSRRRPEGWNDRARRRLTDRLRRHAVWPAVGRWHGWSEQHCLTILPLPLARCIARRFGQNAIVVIRRGAPAALLWTVP